MRLIKKDLARKKSTSQPAKIVRPNTIQHKLGKKITFACDAYLLERIKNALQSQHLAGNYQYASLSQILRQALHAYQKGLPLIYQRQPTNPKQEISLRLDSELTAFYQTFPPYAKTSILERALGTYCQKYLFN
jgi:hypothetical protein